jgi:predicted glycosyltransferase
MKILFDIGHPAHVHLFKNFIFYLLRNKHEVTLVSRKKDVTESLLNHYNIPHTAITEPGRNFFYMFLELMKRTFYIYKLYKKKKFSFAFGTSFSIGYISFVSKMKSFNFTEDDDNIIPLYTYLTYPFSTKIINPSCLIFKKWKEKRVLHNSFHELAYLHPNNFKPNQKILEKYNLKPFEYIIIRFSSLSAYHDLGIQGLRGNVLLQIEQKLKNYPQIVSREGTKSHDIDPWDMHDVLAFAKMIISDSQTMTMEAAVLGVPSIRYNSFVEKISYLKEMESRFDLTYGFLPGRDENKMLNKIDELLQVKNLNNLWLVKREQMLNEKDDFNQWIINYFEAQNEQ